MNAPAPDASAMPALPLVGREREMALLHQLLDDAADGRGRMQLLSGESGLGKSRLARAAADEATRRAWTVAVGRAYPVETGVPYAPISDALLPLLRSLGADARAVLTRGAETELFSLFPALRPPGVEPRPAGPDSPEFKSRVFWTFAEFLTRLAAKQPLLLVVEDLQWADASSLELLHFVARHLASSRVALLCTYNDALRDQNAALRLAEQSLLGLGAAALHRVAPLDQDDTYRLVCEAFGTDEAVVRGFAGHLFHWTRGNPFFIEETLKSLVESGRLFRKDRRWMGWEVEELQLPRSVRDLVLLRVNALPSAARALADRHAVIGTSATYEMLKQVADFDDAEVVEALDALRREQIVEERLAGDTLVYDFRHPLLRETLYTELGLARARLLHAAVAERLEALYGDRAARHADELAFHFARAGAGRLAPKAVRYLASAGRSALRRYAFREAADYLGAALTMTDQQDTGTDDALLADLARARQRIGEYAAAIELWQRIRAAAEERGDPAAVAQACLRIGLAVHWSGQPLAALEQFEQAGTEAEALGEPALRARLHLARGESLQELGRPEAAGDELRRALELADAADDAALLSRVHRALMLLHTWTGPPDQAREHGRRALALSERTGDRGLACTAHWALATMEGLTGNLDAMARHIEQSERLAEEIRSPLHRIWVAEISLEYLSATGQWDAALAIGEGGIKQARAFHQRTLLPRLLVWSALLHFARGDIERGRAYVDEAWQISGAAGSDRAADVHTVVPAHTGRVAYHLARGEYAEAARVGEAGLALADRSGYIVWAIHRLLPMVAEAYLSIPDPVSAERVGERLRRGSEQMDHKAGIAWADACDALLVWLSGDLPRAVELLRDAADRLDAIQLTPDAARVRRQYAARLRDAGEHDEALRQLRHIHEVFVRLGAERELQKTRDQIRELGTRPPAREAQAPGVGSLTPREVEIVRLVAERKSNKAIGAALDISARTVSTHLSSIFRKLNVGSRGELAEVARTLHLRE